MFRFWTSHSAMPRALRYAGIFLCLTVFAAPALSQTVSGTVFRDYNANGTQDAQEPGVEGVTITAFDTTGSVGSATTMADGTYSAALTAGAGTDVRIELSGIPSFLEPGVFGSDSGTTVFFAQSGDSGLDIGLANPGQHCPDTIDVTTSCFVTGPQDGTDGVLVTIPETAGSNTSNPADVGDFDLPAYTVEADASEVGAVWGLAYNSRHDLIYAGSFMKRLSDIGPTDNPTTIYQVDRGTGTVSTWATLDGARANPHSGGTDGWARDFDAFDDVFKEGLGDVDISEDETVVYTVDLGTRELVTIDVNTDGSAGTVSTFSIAAGNILSDLTGDGCAAADIRPFGLGVNDGTLYLGVVCSGQSSVDEAMDLPIEGPIFTGTPTYPGDTSLLQGYVYTWGGGTTFTQQLSFPLDYGRGCLFINNDTNCQDPQPGFWRPWVDTYPYYDQPGSDRHSAGYAQPVISDIEFDNGDLLLGLADRWGHQTGPRSITPAYPLNEPPNTEGELRSPFTGGDLLRACASGGSFLIEESVVPANTSCGTAGTSSNAGGTVVLDEYYFEDNHSSTTEQHSELTLGGMTQIPGRADVIVGVYDPVRTFTNELDDGGLVWLNNAAGTWTKGYRLYNGDLSSPGNLLLKAAGVGDLAPFCPAPSIEVGNRVWDDLDGDGLQDPGEPGLNGVTVRLFCGGSELASTMTSNLGGAGDDGSYLFNDANVTGGIPFDTACDVRIDPADPGLGGRVATSQNTGTNDQNDSDGGPLAGVLGTAFTTGGPGANNHTYDFGFTMMLPPATITTTKTASPTSVPEPGAMVTYTVTVVNDSAVVGVTITSLMDSVSGDLNGQGTCSVPQVIAPSGMYSCQYTVMVSGNDGDTVSCTTTASGTDDNMNPVSDDDPEDVTITGVPSSITVDKSASPTSVPEPGGMVTYTVTVTNTSAADTVTIDTLTDSVSGDLNGQGTCSVPQVLAPSAMYQCQYTVMVSGNPGDTVSCTTTASGTDDDGDPVSDDDPEDVDITGTPSSIEVLKSANPTSVPEPGGMVTYTVMVTNTSAVDTVTIDTLTDSVTGDLNGVGTCSVPQVLAPTESYSCEYTVMVSGNAGDIVSCTVTASGIDDDGDPVSDDDPEDVTITDVPSSITVDKSADPTSVPEPGGDVTFTVTVTNTSAVDTVTIDTLTDDVAGDLNGVGTCSVPQILAPGEDYTCEYTAMVSGGRGDTVTCTVTASGTDDDGDPVSDDDPADVTITGVPSAITVDKSADPTTVNEPGGDVTYTITVTNTSAVDTVTLETITDDVSGDLNGVGTCSVPQILAPGEIYSCEYTVMVTGTAGDTITCTVTVTGTDDDGDPVSGDDPETVTVNGLPQLTAIKEITGGNITAGGNIEYLITVTNVGSADQPDNPGAELLDELDDALTLLDASASSGIITNDFDNNVVQWDGALAVGESVQIMIFAEIDSQASGEIVNQACVFYDGNGDGTNDVKVLSDDPEEDGPEDPNVVIIREVVEIPTLSPVGILAMMVGLLWMGARRLRRRDV